MKKVLQILEGLPQSAAEAPLWKPQPRCGFLEQLPGELRNIIYSLVLRQGDPEQVNLSCLIQPPLTATCRQIRHESLPIFFSENYFKLTIHITPEWHLEPLVEESTQRWIKAAGNDARGLRQVDIYVDRPGRRRRRAVQLLPWKNPHFKTSWSLSIRKDNSDWPHCTNFFIAQHWSKLAKSYEKRISLTFEDVIGIGREAAAIWAPPVHRWAMRRLGTKNVKTIKKVFWKVWPNSWTYEIDDLGCACTVCRMEKREAAKVEKKRKKTLKAEGEETAKEGVAREQ